MPEVLGALSARRARRAFDPRPVPEEVQETLWRAVSVAPSHGNSQPVRVLVAQSPAMREKLVAALSEGNRGWAPAAPLLAAIAAAPEHDPTPKNADGSERPLWGFHAGAATANLMAQATDMGLIAHPMAGFDEGAVRAAFGTPDTLRVLVVVAIGFPGELASLPEDLRKAESRPQDRLPIESLVVVDRWEERHAVSARELRRRANP